MSAFIVAAQLNSHLAQPQRYKLEVVDDELRSMQETLEVLTHGSAELGIGPAEDPEVRLRIDEATHALELYRTVANETRELVESATLSEERLEEASLDVLGSAYGFLALSNLATRSLEEHASRAVRRLQAFQWISVGLAVMITTLTLWAVRRFVLRPIPTFLAAFSDVSGGRYGVHVRVAGENEFSRLATAFNGMSDALERAYRELVGKQTEILEKNAELERAGKLKSQFVSNVSHELRTPLSAVIGYAQLLQRGVYGEVPDSIREALRGIEESTRGLTKLVNDILELAKIDSGRAVVHDESLALADVVREAGDILRPLAVAKGLELRVEAPDGVPSITTDRDKVRRILVNLGANAVKFTRRGSVTLRLGQAGDDRLEVAVEDTGIGIAASDLEQIFEDFVQLEESDTREYAGTGLGLSISRHLARRLAGDIRVESTPGRGSIFTLCLPLQKRTDGDGSGAPVSDPASRPGPSKEVRHGRE
jgi:signal transduction histidine kinase